jgi:hypothetical protein
MIPSDVRLQIMIQRLAPLAAPCDLDREHWLAAAHRDVDASVLYCAPCGWRAVQRLLLVDPGGGYRLDGGLLRYRRDSGEVCAVCGRLFAYRLTEAGAAEELAYFLEEWDARLPLTPEVAYQLAAVLDAYSAPASPSPEVMVLLEKLETLFASEEKVS